MAEVLFFHHVLGRTAGFLALADTIREAGHTVHTPDMFGGATFDSIEAGMDHTRTAGHDPVGVGLRAVVGRVIARRLVLGQTDLAAGERQRAHAESGDPSTQGDLPAAL